MTRRKTCMLEDHGEWKDKFVLVKGEDGSEHRHKRTEFHPAPYPEGLLRTERVDNLKGALGVYMEKIEAGGLSPAGAKAWQRLATQLNEEISRRVAAA